MYRDTLAFSLLQLLVKTLSQFPFTSARGTCCQVGMACVNRPGKGFSSLIKVLLWSSKVALPRNTNTIMSLQTQSCQPAPKFRKTKPQPGETIAVGLVELESSEFLLRGCNRTLCRRYRWANIQTSVMETSGTTWKWADTLTFPVSTRQLGHRQQSDSLVSN